MKMGDSWLPRFTWFVPRLREIVASKVDAAPGQRKTPKRRNTSAGEPIQEAFDWPFSRKPPVPGGFRVYIVDCNGIPATAASHLILWISRNTVVSPKDSRTSRRQLFHLPPPD